MNLQGYSCLSVALLLASIYTAAGVTNSENSRHLPNIRSASVFIVSSPVSLPVFHSFSQPPSTSAVDMKVWMCVVISAVVCEQLWILLSMHKRQQHLRDLSRLPKLNIFHCLWLHVWTPVCVCVRVCTAHVRTFCCMLVSACLSVFATVSTLCTL